MSLNIIKFNILFKVKVFFKGSLITFLSIAIHTKIHCKGCDEVFFREYYLEFFYMIFPEKKHRHNLYNGFWCNVRLEKILNFFFQKLPKKINNKSFLEQILLKFGHQTSSVLSFLLVVRA